MALVLHYASLGMCRAYLAIEEENAMETPQIRPGAIKNPESRLRVVAFFHNAAEGNLAIQLLTSIGIPSDGLGRHDVRPDRRGAGDDPLHRLPEREGRSPRRRNLPQARWPSPSAAGVSATVTDGQDS